MDQRDGKVAARPTGAGQPELQALIEATLRETHAGAPGLPPVTLASALDQDLGFDSLTRTELLDRIEHGFGIRLPPDTLQRAETVGDLLAAVQRAGPAPGPPPASPRRTAAPPAEAETVTAAGAAPPLAETLLDVLDWHLRTHPDRIQLTCLGEDGGAQPLSHRRLAETAAAVAASLRRAGVRPRQCVALMLPTSPEYFGCYLGILRAAAIPVPIYPPARASQLEEHVLRHAGILDNAQAVLLVTVPEAMGVARLLRARVSSLRQVITAQRLQARGTVAEAQDRAPRVRGDDIAFIQYTSGSTGQPKGVVLTHANLLANIRAMQQVVQATPRDVFVSWLPLYHDMGLIGAWLGALVAGYALVVMSPLSFLARPERWLQAIHRYRGTLSAAPNFAYELCVRRIDDAALAGLDLSCWRLAFNGAEAVRAETLQRFGQRFAACGLRPHAVIPVYGLAEAGLGLLFPPPGRPARVDRVQREPLTRTQRALPAAADDAGALCFVGCGSPLPGHAVRLVDGTGAVLGERTEGRLEFQGPSATLGYFRNPAQTARLFDGGWLDTGDRAYRADGEYFITGRVKDVVIRAGRNLYPEEIEQAVGAVDGVRRGCVAVFGSPDPTAGTERLVVLAEVRPGDAAARARWRAAVAQAVVDTVGEPADEIVLVPPHSVLKTSSGKLRRAACRTLYETGRLGAAPPPAWRQWLRLVGGSAAQRLRRASGAVGAALFGVYAWLVFGLLAPTAWLLTMALPGPERAWRADRWLVRGLLRLTGTPLLVRGLDHLPDRPCVFVCNHASYLDGLVLVAALPCRFAFVAKSELQDHALLRRFLQRLGSEFVDRVDARRSVADAARLTRVVADGRSLLFFPEGSFGIGPGLLPFHLGAFLVAVRAGVPVLPVVLRGTREMLPGDRWWPQRARLEVELGPALPAPVAIPTEGEAFDAAVGLRATAQREIEQQLRGG